MTKGEENVKSDYKLSQFGLIPSNWDVENVESLTIDHKQGYYTKEEYSDKGKYILLRGMDLNSPDVNWSDSPKVDASNEEYELYKVEIGDFLFVRSGNIGTYGIVKGDMPPSIFASYLIRFKLDQKRVLNYYFGSFYSSRLCINQLKKITQGSSNININANNIKSLEIPLPPLPEQKAIAHVLGLMDSAINTTNQLIAKKELQKKWLMQNLLTDKKRLKGFDGEWEEHKLGNLFTHITNVNDGVDGHSIMTISSKMGLISQEDKFDRIIAGDSLKKYTQVKKGDFAYNKGNSKTFPMGCIYQLEEKESALVPFVYICFTPKDKIDSKFYKQWFFAHGLDRKLNKIITSGARGDGLLNVNTHDFFNLKIPFPSFEEQSAIAIVLQTADKEIQLLKSKSEKLREQKKGLMQVLLTGKKRLLTN